MLSQVETLIYRIHMLELDVSTTFLVSRLLPPQPNHLRHLSKLREVLLKVLVGGVLAQASSLASSQLPWTANEYPAFSHWGDWGCCRKGLARGSRGRTDSSCILRKKR